MTAIDADVRIVCFDIGGVLVRIHRSWPEVCGAAGLDPRGDWSGEANALAYQTLTDLLGTGQITEEEWASRLSIAVNGRYSPDELIRIHAAWMRAEYTGVGRLIDDLHASRVETACLSNTTYRHWIRLTHKDRGQPLSGAAEFPAVQRLRRHFASHVLGLAKPDPAIYQAVEAATGFGGPQILFFDDLAPNVAAARALGWNAELIDPFVETAPQLRHHLQRHLGGAI